MKKAEPKRPYPLLTELTEMILSKLPLESLKRLLTVNKEWYNSITSTQFLNQHLNFTNSLQGHNTHWLVHCTVGKGVGRRAVYVLYSDDDVDVSVDVNVDVDGDDGDDDGDGDDHRTRMFDDYARLTAPIEGSMKEWRIDGCCNGLVCLCDDEKAVILWNPSIRRFLHLPESTIALGNTFGFVFDHVKSDFKVLRTSLNGDGDIQVEIYRLSTKLWEPWTKEIPPYEELKGYQVDLTGVAHWPGKDSEGNLMILSFDVHNEVFASIAVPASLAEDDAIDWSSDSVCLFLFEESLVLIHNTGADYDFWKMEEYGKGESWNLWHQLRLNDYRTPYGFRKNGEFLWFESTSREFISTNLENSSDTYLGGYVADQIHSCYNYVKSLALLRDPDSRQQ